MKRKIDEKHPRLSNRSTWQDDGKTAHHKYHAAWEQDIGATRSDLRELHAPISKRDSARRA